MDDVSRIDNILITHQLDDTYHLTDTFDINTKNPCNCSDSSESNKNNSFFNLFLTTLTDPGYLFVYASIIIISILFLVSYFFGVYSTWYQNIKKTIVNTWIIEILWIISTILSYVGLLFLWDGSSNQYNRNLCISVLFLIGNFITLAWSVMFFQINNLSLAVWLSIAIFVYNFWVFIYIWYINIIAAIFFIPILLMYIYLIYTTIHTASINNIPL